MKEYTPSGKTPEELAAEIQKLEEESGNKKHYFLSACIRLNVGEVSVDGFYDGWVVFIKD